MRRQEPNGQVGSPYMSLREVARHFRVDESTVRKGCGVFALLRITSTDLEPGRKRGRKLVIRESVERVDAILEERAAAATAPLRLAKKRA
jgi:hypothetical protein